MEKPYFLTRKLLCYTIYVTVSILILHFICVYESSSINPITLHEEFTGSVLVRITSSNESSSAMVTPKEDNVKSFNAFSSCDYSKGTWIPSELKPLYNETSCFISDGLNCIGHGRQDTGYLNWRWKPSGDECELPRFDPKVFIELMINKHLAFVGDSLARNQMESLICMLSSLYQPTLIYSQINYKGGSRWNFPSHNLNVSQYRSVYLVKGTEAPNRLIYVDTIDEEWTSDLGLIDVLVLSFGHWFQSQFAIFEGDLEVACHDCPIPNHIEIGIDVAFKKALRTAFKAIIDQTKASNDHHIGRNSIDVIVTTYSGDHFEGLWNIGASCPKTEPYAESKVVTPLFEQMRKVAVEAVKEARFIVMNMGLQDKVRIMTLDVTKLSWLRPDAHPGPYMHPFPFANRNNQTTPIQEDCLHWCLPGAIDTWNEIMLQIIKDWQIRSS